MTEEEKALANYNAIVESCNEVILYFCINENGGLAWRLRHDATRDYARGYLNEDQYNERMKAAASSTNYAEIAVKQTTRFGVTKPLHESGGPTDEYWLWFRWWDGYIKGLSEDDFRELDRKLSAKEDVSKFRPNGDWKVVA